MPRARQFRHGVGGYSNRRCRCNRCKGAWNKYMRDYRAKRRAEAKAERSQGEILDLQPLAMTYPIQTNPVSLEEGLSY